MRRTCLPLLVVLLALLIAAFAAPSAAQKKKKADEGKKAKKQFHEFLYFEYTVDKSKWVDMGKSGLGIRYKGVGPVVILYSQYFETPGGSSGTYNINGQGIKPTNHGSLVKEMMKEAAAGFKKVFKEGKSKKFKCKAGKGVYIDLIASKPEGKRARGITDMFTRTASGVDVSQPYDPKTIKAHFRWVAIKQKEGVHLLFMGATEGVLKKQKKDIAKFFKALTAE